jgi:hypothetical protein
VCVCVFGGEGENENEMAITAASDSKFRIACTAPHIAAIHKVICTREKHHRVRQKISHLQHTFTSVQIDKVAEHAVRRARVDGDGCRCLDRDVGWNLVHIE